MTGHCCKSDGFGFEGSSQLFVVIRCKASAQQRKHWAAGASRLDRARMVPPEPEWAASQVTPVCRWQKRLLASLRRLKGHHRAVQRCSSGALGVTWGVLLFRVWSWSNKSRKAIIDCHEDYAVICNSSHLAGCRAEVSKQGTSDQCLAAGNCHPLNGRIQAALTACPPISSACLWSSVSVMVLTAGLQPSVLLECLGSALPFANHSNGRPGD